MYKSILKNIGVGILVLIVAGIGVYLGMSFRTTQAMQEAEPSESQGPSSLLTLNSPFPTVNLMKHDSTMIGTPELVSQDGSVFLFLEMGCPPCETMTAKWQKLINDGKIDRNQVIGVSFEQANHVANYAIKRGLTFPIYIDTGFVFMRQYGVMEYPFVAVVGKSGLVEMTTYDSRLEFDSEEISAQLAH